MNKGRIIIFSIGGVCLLILIGVFIFLLSGEEKENESKPPVLNQDNSFGYSDMINQLDDEKYDSRNVQDSAGAAPKLNLKNVYFNEDESRSDNRDYWDDDDEDYTPEPVIYRQQSQPEIYEPEPIITAVEPQPEPIAVDPLEELRKKKERLESWNNGGTENKNITVAINGTQTIKNGQTVAMRLLSDANVSGVKLEKNSIIYGVAKFEKYRVGVNVTSVRSGNKIAQTNMVVYGMDGQPGIPVNANQILSETKQRTTKEVEEEIDNLNIPGTNIVTDIFTKNRDAKVKLINNHKLILIPNNK